MSTGTAFFAYPSTNPLVLAAIRGVASDKLKNGISVKPWESMDILGFKLDNLVRESIVDADFLAADVTFPNHNVYYELGYALALGKPVLPTLNTAIQAATNSIRRIGLFDTTGYAGYSNAQELTEHLEQWSARAWQNKASEKETTLSRCSY